MKDLIKKILEIIKNHKKVSIGIFSAFIITIIMFMIIIVFSNNNNNDIKETETIKESSSEIETDTKEIIIEEMETTEYTIKEETEELTTVVKTEQETVYDDGLEDYDLHLSEEQKNPGKEVDVSLVTKNEEYAKGIDVSKWQGKIDWSKVKDSGIEFAIVRIGYRSDDTGQIFEDTFASYNLYNGDLEGIYMGAYFFSTAISKAEAEEEARWVVNYIKKYSITYPVVYNCEGFTNEDSRMYGISNADRTEYALAFLNIIKDAGYDAVMYASELELTDDKYYNTADIEDNYNIWVARYPEVTYPDIERPSYTGKYNMWQYTNQGIVQGIEGYVDLDISYYKVHEREDPVDNSGLDVIPDSVEAGVSFIKVNELVTAKIETNLRSEMSTLDEDSVIYTLSNGEYIERTGIGSNGWSRLLYNGQTVYAVTSLLTKEVETTTAEQKDTTIVENTTQEITTSEIIDIETTDSSNSMIFTEVNDSVTAKEETNLRDFPSTDNSSVVYLLKNGEYVERIGISSKGWSKLIYDGKVVYAVSSLLTTE